MERERVKRRGRRGTKVWVEGGRVKREREKRGKRKGLCMGKGKEEGRKGEGRER